nr:hypothetical protein [Tanacetum cinerariifolium]
ADLRHLGVVSDYRAGQPLPHLAGRLLGAQEAISANLLLPRGGELRRAGLVYEGYADIEHLRREVRFAVGAGLFDGLRGLGATAGRLPRYHYGA